MNAEKFWKTIIWFRCWSTWYQLLAEFTAWSFEEPSWYPNGLPSLTWYSTHMRRCVLLSSGSESSRNSSPLRGEFSITELENGHPSRKRRARKFPRPTIEESLLASWRHPWLDLDNEVELLSSASKTWYVLSFCPEIIKYEEGFQIFSETVGWSTR